MTTTPNIIPLRKARSVAEAFADRLISSSCVRVAIAGSIRRNRSMVGDIDIVAIPRIDYQYDLLGSPMAATHRGNDSIKTLGNTYHVEQLGPEISKIHIDGIQIDIFWATIDTFGSVFLCRTGSKEHNIALASYARARGKRWIPNKGVAIQGDTTFPAPEESIIYDLLDLPFIPIQQRDPENLHPALAPFVHPVHSVHPVHPVH